MSACFIVVQISVVNLKTIHGILLVSENFEIVSCGQLSSVCFEICCLHHHLYICCYKLSCRNETSLDMFLF